MPARFQELIDVGSITIRSKPFSDNEVILQTFYLMSIVVAQFTRVRGSRFKCSKRAGFLMGKNTGGPGDKPSEHRRESTKFYLHEFFKHGEVTQPKKIFPPINANQPFPF